MIVMKNKKNWSPKLLDKRQRKIIKKNHLKYISKTKKPFVKK